MSYRAVETCVFRQKALVPDSRQAGWRTRRKHGFRRSQCTVSGDSPSIAQDLTYKLAKHFYEVQHPALSNRPYSQAVQDFTDSAILAYECGYSESNLREQIQATEDVTKAANDLDFDDCVLCTSLVWVTLMIGPQSVKRWASGSAVTEETLQTWRGFVSMIVNGYFDKRMAWFPLDRLQLELSAVKGKAESPDIIAERARLVYTTLERVHPQFPTM